jgi:hypothetical protein
MPAQAGLESKASDPAAVDAYLKVAKHPLLPVVVALRKIILKTDPQIGEEIKWNAPAFFYAGPMKPSDPKEYRRYLIIFNLAKKDCVRLVFWRGDRAGDKSGFLTGDYADGRRLATVASMIEVKTRTMALQAALRKQLKHLV